MDHKNISKPRYSNAICNVHDKPPILALDNILASKVTKHIGTFAKSVSKTRYRVREIKQGSEGASAADYLKATKGWGGGTGAEKEFDEENINERDIEEEELEEESDDDSFDGGED